MDVRFTPNARQAIEHLQLAAGDDTPQAAIRYSIALRVQLVNARNAGRRVLLEDAEGYLVEVDLSPKLPRNLAPPNTPPSKRQQAIRELKQVGVVALQCAALGCLVGWVSSLIIPLLTYSVAARDLGPVYLGFGVFAIAGASRAYIHMRENVELF